MEKKISRAILSNSIHCNSTQLHDVGAVWSPHRAPAQHSRHHHQWCRHADRDLLHPPLPPLLPRPNEATSVPHVCRVDHLCCRHSVTRHHARTHPRAPVDDRGDNLCGAVYHYVCFPSVCHGTYLRSN